LLNQQDQSFDCLWDLSGLHLLLIHRLTEIGINAGQIETYGSVDFVTDNPGEPVPEETFTHSHSSWSSIIPYLLLPSTTIHGILPI